MRRRRRRQHFLDGGSKKLLEPEALKRRAAGSRSRKHSVAVRLRTPLCDPQPQSENRPASLRSGRGGDSRVERTWDVIDAGCMDARRDARMRSMRPFPSKGSRGGRRRVRKRGDA